MIKIENVDVYGWEAAIRGMRNSYDSWDKSDSYSVVYCGKCGKIEREGCCNAEYRDCTGFEGFDVGPNDLKLMKKLSAAGASHRKFMRMLTVSADIVAPLYWYKEYDTYKVGTVANSCSTMHKIHAKEFTLDDFSHEHLLTDPYDPDAPENALYHTINVLNFHRDTFLKTKDKVHWWQLIQLLPSSYNQRRTVHLSYETLEHMYHDRKAHKLDEWRAFCDWIETLPYAKELICKTEGAGEQK